MSELSLTNQATDVQEAPGSAARRVRAALRAHERNVRFHILLNLGFALAATWVLKVDGPYYADAIAAGLFVCGCLLSLWSRSVIVHGENNAGLRRSRGLNILFIAFALFFLAAAVAIVYYTYIVPPDIPYDEEGLTRTQLNVSLIRRQFA